MTFIHAPLLQPLRIGAMTIQNRFCAGPLTLPSLQGPFGEFSPDGLAYFEARAKGGFGLLFTGAFHPDTLVDPVHPLDSKQPLKAPKTFQRSAVELLERLDAYGTKMLPQVSMGYGRNALGCFCPSEIPYYHDPARRAPALTREQIQQKIDQMIATAVLLRQCGFPGIEVHAMHWGYLLDQFALSFMNHRTDEYGGALENRLRCAREIVEGVKAACGADFVVSMRLALKSYIKGYNKPSLHGEEEVGRTLEEGLEIARRLEAYGYDCLRVGRRAGCAVNPQAAREASFALTPASRKKSVLVVGGGVAGMEAARCAALRGHDVTLCEGSDRLGGNLIPAGAHPFKEELNELNRWYQGQLAQLGVTVELGVRLTAREIQDRSPDAVVLAVGAAPAVPPVPGIDSPKVIDCVTALTGPDLPGQRVLVVGGGLVGCETALGYAQAGKQVTILEALPDILSAGIPVPEMNDSMLRDLLDEAGVVRRTGRRLSRVTEDGAVADGPDGEEKLPADHIVLAVGFTPRTSLAPELAGAGMEVYQVGDGSRVGSVMTAIGSAYTVGRML